MFLDFPRRLFTVSIDYMMMKAEIEKPNTFLYFSYGTNMLTFRIQMHNPSAEFVSIARLDNYRLDFIKYSSFWGGPTATLVPTANGHVWGVIWRLNKEDIEKLDSQKGVAVNKYYIKNLRVLTQYMGYFTVRVYIQKINPLPRGDNDPIPLENWPSWTYKEIMVMGATEHNFPEYYIKQLKKLEDNGEEGALRTVCLLIKYAENEPCECRVPGRIPRKPLKLDLNLVKKGRNLLTPGHKNTAPALPQKDNKVHYRLDFLQYSDKWRGTTATIVPTANMHVWGAVWRLHVRDIRSLDQSKEGISTGYFAKAVNIITSEGYEVQCRTYQQYGSPPLREPGESLPIERRPSICYLDCIIQGALERGLPLYYVEELMKIPDNKKELMT